MAVTLQTSLGDIKLELACRETPKTCKNFLALCASGYYNGTKFHRNIKGFAIQGGDPTGMGKGGESIYGPVFDDEFDTSLKGSPNSNGSQFFITYSRQPHLNGTYTVFGRVIDGMDTLDKMEKDPITKKNKPIKEILLHRVIIHANPIADEDVL